MSELHSEASKKRWAKIPKVERSARMSEIAKERMKNLSPQQRKKIGRALVKAREEKRG